MLKALRIAQTQLCGYLSVSASFQPRFRPRHEPRGHGGITQKNSALWFGESVWVTFPLNLPLKSRLRRLTTTFRR
jgi:hypothetical protein